MDDIVGGGERDHPRSRGVYQGRVRGLTRTRGSSPLARGLRLYCLYCLVRWRIIPARAGFTMAATIDQVLRRDHPRSRGVYPFRSPEPPLGRGIIPARAGFTGPAQGRPRSPRDHPRSRGVYAWTASAHRMQVGSSPLARGLRLLGLAIVIWAVDHPRSRGVYGHGCDVHAVVEGSSPLARGLPVRGPVNIDSLGIIPARAGFTRRRRSRPRP